MAWKVRISPAAEKDIARLDRPVQKKITAFLHELEASDNPRLLMLPYTGPLAGFWKKRLGDYRLVFDIQDGALTVLVVKAGHRSKIYR